MHFLIVEALVETEGANIRIAYEMKLIGSSIINHLNVFMAISFGKPINTCPSPNEVDGASSLSHSSESFDNWLDKNIT